MANITLGILRDYWKRVYDAITGPPGSAAPDYAMQVGGTDGTNLRAMKMDADGHPQVDVLTLPSVSAADGGIASIGAKADAAVTDPTLSASEIALLKGLLKQLQGTGPVVTPVLQNGRKASRVQTVLTTTPLEASASYTQPGIDAEAWAGANGTGAIVVSGMAKSDKPGTLFLDVSHDNTTWITWDAALANSTGVARLKPITIPLRYFRFRYVNGDQAQASFALVQNIMQEGDGRGGEHGAGMDLFRRYGTLAADTTETIMDVRSPVEVVFLQCASDYSQVNLKFQSYKDDGSSFYVAWDSTAVGAGSSYSNILSAINDVGHPWFEVLKWDGTNNKYAIKKRDSVPGIFARGLKLEIINGDTVAHKVSVHCFVRIF